MPHVSLTPHLEEFIQKQMETGGYASPSEVVREALRLLEEEKQVQRERARQAGGPSVTTTDHGSAPAN